MKKMFVFASLIICFVLSSNGVLAAEVTYQIERSLEPQEALVIGRVDGIDRKGYVEFYNVRLVSGKLDSNTFLYRFSDMKDFSEVDIGDTYLLSVKKINETDIYEEAFKLCYSVIVDENRKIKINEKVDESGEIIELEWFCNTGNDLQENEDGEYFEINKETGEQTLVFSMESHKWYKNSASDIYSAPDMNSECIQWNWLFVFCIILCLSLCLFVFRKTLMRHYPTPGDWKGD